jgi:glycosyltransferase involved in cell wall biosynthesis
MGSVEMLWTPEFYRLRPRLDPTPPVTLTVGLDTTYGYLSDTGIGRYVRSLSAALAELEDPRVVEFAAIREPATNRPRRLAQAVRREGGWYPFTLSRRALAAGCTVLHVPHPTVVRAGRLPLVVTVHDLQPLIRPRLFTHWPRAQLRASIPVVRRAARVVTHSEATREGVIERLGVPADRVVAAPLGVSAGFGPADPANVLARLGIEGRYLLSVGALEPRKNLTTTIRAYERVAAAAPDVRLVVVGPRGWRNGEFDSLAAKAPGVQVTGYLPDRDLAALYSGASCFVYPSLGEGFGLPVLEAMACGAPIVASNRTSLPEVVGDAGLLTDAEDEEEVSDAILRILMSDGLSAELSGNALRRAAEFTWERCAAVTARAYREAMAS